MTEVFCCRCQITFIPIVRISTSTARFVYVSIHERVIMLYTHHDILIVYNIPICAYIISGDDERGLIDEYCLRRKIYHTHFYIHRVSLYSYNNHDIILSSLLQQPTTVLLLNCDSMRFSSYPNPSCT